MIHTFMELSLTLPLQVLVFLSFDMVWSSHERLVQFSMSRKLRVVESVLPNVLTMMSIKLYTG